MTKTKKLALESTGSSDMKRIVDPDKKVVAMAMRYTGGTWAVHDVDTDAKLCRPVHKTPTAAMRWFETQQEAPE